MMFMVLSFLSACINTITGIEHPVDDEYLQGCSTRCTCESGGNPDCESVPCDYDNGATCTAWGDPHYTSFDGRTYDYQGRCQYTHVQECSNSEFSIKTRHSPCPHISATCVSEVTIEVTEGIFVLARGDPVPVTINGNGWSAISTVYELDGVEVRRAGIGVYVFLKTIGIKVFWNGRYTITVTASRDLHGKLCGLCGTYNGNQNDDYQKKDETLTTSVTQFGNSWVVPGSCPSSGKRNALETPGCSTDPAVIQKGRERCAVLMGEVFGTCNSIVNPAGFIKSCEFDYACCSGEGQEDCYCDNLATYAGACADAGVTLSSWRKFFCRKLPMRH